ncbi:MAG: hypothetical protein OJF59_002149 [Cytophagales bacterium]|nr:MAG: hypothetical protein OJF59_002149 [Cytophagales bacterium]
MVCSVILDGAALHLPLTVDYTHRPQPVVASYYGSNHYKADAL